MKFKELSTSDIDFIKKIHSEKKNEERDLMLSNYFGITQRTVRVWIEKLQFSERTETEPEIITFAKSREIPKAKIYLITSAQNATPVHAQLLQNMQVYAKLIGAEILVIPYRYKNPTSVFSDIENDNWEACLHPYLVMQRVELNDNLTLLGDIKIQPTNSNPLSGCQSITGHKSAILGHPRLTCFSVPVIAGTHVKGLYTTGSCTIQNYTDSKIGKLGEFHHVLGFAVVEIVDNEHFYCRNVSADSDGNFIDIVNSVSFGEYERLESVNSVVLGDLHAYCAAEKRVKGFTNLASLNPKNLVLHDVADGLTVNPHEKDNHILQIKRMQSEKNNVAKELEHLRETLQKIKDTFLGSKIYVVKSNHDEFFDRWVNTSCWKKDYTNAATYLELVQIAIKSDNGIIPYLIDSWFLHEIECLRYNESKRIKGIEISLHGHSGNNGAKGSASQFRQLSTKIITAHNHGFVIMDGVYQVGTCTERFQSYNKGASGAAWADCIITENGKRQLLVWSNGNFTTLL